MKNFFKKTRTDQLERPIVVVSGLPRSGTSLMMMMLEAAGIPPFTDLQRQADGDNPRGYYEFERVKKLKDGDTGWIDLARGKSVKVISALLAYLPSEYSYKVFFMRRSLPEILASQRKMLLNRGEDPDKISDEEMALYFSKHLSQVMQWLDQQKNFSVLYVDYNEMLKNPQTQVHQINQFLGGKLDESLMLAAIDPDLYRQRK